MFLFKLAFVTNENTMEAYTLEHLRSNFVANGNGDPSSNLGLGCLHFV